ncbi:MAG: hypothetical protein AAB019_05435 [Planctomycetota bacterium]
MKYGIIIGVCALVTVFFILNGTALTQEKKLSPPSSEEAREVGARIKMVMENMNGRIEQLEDRVNELEEFIIDIEDYLVSLEDELGIVIETEKTPSEK